MINKFRGFLVVCCFGIFGIGAVLIRYLILIFPEHFISDKEKKLKSCENILRKSWKLFIWLLESLRIIKVNKTQLEGLKNIKNSIIVSTHPSFIDVVLLMSVIPDTTCFVAEKLARNPFFKGMVDLLFILESKDIKEWESSALDKINKGFNVLIFPMGGRHRAEEKPKIRKGAALLAQRSGKNIVMLKITTSYAWLVGGQPINEIQRKPVVYNISNLGEINTERMLFKYPDEVTFRKEVTDIIAKNLYE